MCEAEVRYAEFRRALSPFPAPVQIHPTTSTVMLLLRRVRAPPPRPIAHHAFASSARKAKKEAADASVPEASSDTHKYADSVNLPKTDFSVLNCARPARTMSALLQTDTCIPHH